MMGVTHWLSGRWYIAAQFDNSMMQRKERYSGIIGLLVVAMLFDACTYYKSVVISQGHGQAEALEQIHTHWQHGDPIFIHSRNGTYRLREFTGEQLPNRLVCSPEFTDEITSRFTQPYRQRGRFRRRKGEGQILRQVHVFATESLIVVPGTSLVLDSTAVLRVEQIKPDRVKNVLLTSALVLTVSAASLTAFVVYAINRMTVEFDQLF